MAQAIFKAPVPGNGQILIASLAAELNRQTCNAVCFFACISILLQAIFKAPVPGDGQSCIAASCGAALKDMLARIMRGNTDASKPWRSKLDAALRAMGADAVADSAQRHIERAAAR
jgi:hypothetical protein